MWQVDVLTRFAVNRVGFTGTRDGMTAAQMERVEDWLRLYDWLHHGDCVGADAQAHLIGRMVGISIAGHPPRNPKKRAFCEFDLMFPTQDYIPRNHVIIDSTDELLATPKQMREVRSGTWVTVWAARKRGKAVNIVYPDGSMEFQ